MNLRPFTSSPSPSLYSQSPPRANPRSSLMAVPRSTESSGMHQWCSAITNLSMHIQLGLAPMQEDPLRSNFREHSPHLDGSTVHIAAADNSMASFGSDDVVYSLDLSSHEEANYTLINDDREEITALVMDPRNSNSFLIGTAAGFVKRLWPMHQYNLRLAIVLFKCNQPIKSLSIHPKGKLLGIATGDEQAIVFSLIDQRVYSLYNSHEGGTIRVSFGGDYVFSQGMQGFMHLYSITAPPSPKVEDDDSDEDPLGQSITGEYNFTFIDKYRIATETVAKRFPFLNAAYAEFKGEQNQKIIIAGGQTSLQVVSVQGNASQYRIERNIRQIDQILMVLVLNEEDRLKTPKCIVTSSHSYLSIWNYSRKEKIFTLPVTDILKGFITEILPIGSPSGPSFLFILNHVQSSGKFYQFANHSLLSTSPPQAKPSEARMPQKEQKFVSRWEEESHLEKIVRDLTQYLLEKHYQEHQGSRFLYYNSIGCVIERTEGGNTTLELELHDKSRPKRLSLDSSNRPFWLFAIRQDILIYATTNLLVFKCDRHLREGFQAWQFRWDNIQAISIGNSWVALCATEAVKILDYAGNQLHTICFDRRLVAFEAYEDMLAIVYHSAPPMWGCQVLKMRVYQVTVESVRMERECLLPMKANSLLKWFGFSEQGMLYCQDTLQIVRCYLFERDEWMPVHSLEGSTDRLYIQHISGSDIYGFRLQQKEGKREEPKVLPRSLPRRIPMNLPSLPIVFLQPEEQSHLKRLRLRNIQLQHESFRYKRWYKYKYSRSKGNLWFAISRTILSAEELKTASTQLDLQLLDYLKKFLKRWEDRHTREFQKAAQALILVVQREAHFEETKESARIMLEMGKRQKSPIFEDCPIAFRKKESQSLSKLNQVNILEKMLTIMNKS